LGESASAVRRISFLRPRRRVINSVRLMKFKLGFQPLRPPPGYSLDSFPCSTSPPPPERPLNYFDMCFVVILVIGSGPYCFLPMHRKTTLRSLIIVEGSSSKECESALRTLQKTPPKCSKTHLKPHHGVFPCGGGVEYLHHSSASRRKQRKGHPVPGGISEPPYSWGI
jgi:hypothetical protein